MPALQWFTEAIDFYGLREISMTAEIAVRSVELPLLHNDPCDRILVSTAQLNGLEIVTCDQLISQYKVKILW